MASPEIRTADSSDTPQILEVLRAALGETPLLRFTPKLFEWKHISNPFGKSIIVVAVKDDQIVGVRALMRWELETPQGGVLKCVRPVDTATHPAYLRQGIFRMLTLSALEIARQENIDLVFNTPNEQSAPGYLRMGWRHVCWTGAMVRPRLGHAVRVSRDEAPTLRQIIPHASPFTPKPNLDRQPVGLRTKRTPSYQAWRFREHPTAEYGWIGQSDESGAVIRPSERRGISECLVVDLLNGADSLALRKVTKTSRSRYVATWFSQHSPEVRYARSAGMVRVPWLKTLRIMALPLRDLGPSIFRPEAWDLAVSDLELL